MPRPSHGKGVDQAGKVIVGVVDDGPEEGVPRRLAALPAGEFRVVVTATPDPDDFMDASPSVPFCRGEAAVCGGRGWKGPSRI